MQGLALDSVGVLRAQEGLDQPLALNLVESVHTGLAVGAFPIQVVLPLVLVLAWVFYFYPVFTDVLFAQESREVVFRLVNRPRALGMDERKFRGELVWVRRGAITWQASLEFVLSVSAEEG